MATNNLFNSQPPKPSTSALPSCKHRSPMGSYHNSSTWTCRTFLRIWDRAQLRRFAVSHSHAKQFHADYRAISLRFPLMGILAERWFALKFKYCIAEIIITVLIFNHLQPFASDSMYELKYLSIEITPLPSIDAGIKCTLTSSEFSTASFGICALMDIVWVFQNSELQKITLDRNWRDFYKHR